MNDNEFVNINSRGTSAANTPNRLANKKKKTKSGVVALRIVSGILAAVFLVAGIGVGLFGMWFNGLTNYSDGSGGGNSNKPKPVSTDASGNTLPEIEGIELEANSGELLNDPYVLNIMLFGTDRYGDAGLSDTMILLSIDNRHQKIKMTSFLRDTYVSIPGYYPHKLNLSYALGSAPLAIQTIEQNYGVQVDRYATVNFATFQEIVDIMGGVEIELTGAEIDYINAQIWENGQPEYLNASPGMVTLSGQQALWYARNRGGTYGGQTFSGDDWDRTDRQRKFMNAVIDQMKDASLTEIVAIVNEVGPQVTTDLKKTEITMLLKNALTFLNYDVEQCHMPSDGTWSYGWNEAGSVILVNDWYQARLDLATFIYEDSVAG